MRHAPPFEGRSTATPVDGAPPRCSPSCPAPAPGPTPGGSRTGSQPHSSPSLRVSWASQPRRGWVRPVHVVDGPGPRQRAVGQPARQPRQAMGGRMACPAGQRGGRGVRVERAPGRGRPRRPRLVPLGAAEDGPQQLSGDVPACVLRAGRPRRAGPASPTPRRRPDADGRWTCRCPPVPRRRPGRRPRRAHDHGAGRARRAPRRARRRRPRARARSPSILAVRGGTASDRPAEPGHPWLMSPSSPPHGTGGPPTSSLRTPADPTGGRRPAVADRTGSSGLLPPRRRCTRPRRWVSSRLLDHPGEEDSPHRVGDVQGHRFATRSCGSRATKSHRNSRRSPRRRG